MDTIGVTPAHIVVNADFLAVGSTEFAISDFGPSQFAIRELGGGDAITVVFSN
jgi:hypothetical protein